MSNTISALSSPFLSSYAGLSGSQLTSLANLQSNYHQVPPFDNQNQAYQYLQAANQPGVAPALQSQLLQDAINVLTPQGSSSSPGSLQPLASNASPFSDSVGPVMQDSSSYLQQTIQQLQQEVSQLTSELNGLSSSFPSGAGAGSAASAVPAGNGVDSTASPLSVSGNSVNTGQYTITGSTNDDGSLTITNNQTGQSTEVWGDPHIKVNGQDTADFQKSPLNIQLQDGTVVHIDPTALNSNGVAHIGQVSITKGDQTVTMGGASSNGFEGSVNTSSVQNGISNYSSALYDAPNATNITLGADGNLYYNNANGSMGAEITPTNGGETDLDNAGGGLVGDPAGAGSPGGSSGNINSQIEQLEQLTQSFSGSFLGMMMQSLLSQMQSTSGYASV